jgi:predicted nucleic acid-binding protein
VIVVSDASPLISLATIGRLELLHALYGSVAIPEAVRAEVLSGDRPGSAEVAAAPWIEVRSVQNTLFPAALGVGRGEGEAILLAIELKADRLLADERQARRIARRFGLEIIGVAGILVEAKRARPDPIRNADPGRARKRRGIPLLGTVEAGCFGKCGRTQRIALAPHRLVRRLLLCGIGFRRRFCSRRVRARRRWQRSYRCLRRAQPGSEPRRGTRPKTVVR